MKRDKVKQELEGTPCACWSSGGSQFHHSLFRESVAKTPKQKQLLYDARNGLLVHPKCHMRENIYFRRNCAILITQRHGGPAAILDYVDEIQPLWRTTLIIPEVWYDVWDKWEDKSKKPCPACGVHKIHNYLDGLIWESNRLKGPGLVCWNCLWLSE